jgi:HEAT repeat protein
LPEWTPKPESATELRDCLNKEGSWQARAEAAAKLGEMGDEESMPALLRAMEDPNPAVRGRAAAAVRKIMKADYFFRANDPPERRKQVIAIIKGHWEGYLSYKNRQPAISAGSRGAPR